MEREVKDQTASMEDYLEAIALLGESGEVVRVNQMSRALGVKMPSVTSALKKLSEQGLAEHERYGYVKLTPEGSKLAKEVIHRHQVLSRFLSEILGVDSEVADGDACKMEHALSSVSLERLAKFVEFIVLCPRGEPEWLKAFDYYVEHGRRPLEVMKRCLGDVE